MLNKQQIEFILKTYSLDPCEFIILSGAALVMYGIKDLTNDIDIAVSKEYMNYLLTRYQCSIEKYDAKNQTYVYFIDGIINFSTNYYNVENIYNNGYRLQSIRSILELKESLNREKDQNDLIKIKKYLHMYKR